MILIREKEQPKTYLGAKFVSASRTKLGFKLRNHDLEINNILIDSVLTEYIIDETIEICSSNLGTYIADYRNYKRRVHKPYLTEQHITRLSKKLIPYCEKKKDYGVFFEYESTKFRIKIIPTNLYKDVQLTINLKSNYKNGCNRRKAR